jgi:hypothetical protein
LRSPRSADLRSFIRRYPWWLVAAALLVFSAALVLLVRTRPGYDPYGWLVWGYQTLHGNLDLGGAPSWKPLTWLFDVPFALFGNAALWLWMFTAVAGALGGAIFAGRLAYRLVARDSVAGAPGGRYPAIAAGVFAGLALLGIQDYLHYILSVQSDPMVVTLCLAAIDCHLGKHPRWAFVLGVLAGLARPEVWPFLGLYAIWAWRTIPSMRWLICAGLATIPALWFGIPTITNGRPFVAGQLALRSPRELHNNEVIGTWQRYTALTYFPIELAAVVAAVWGYLRRNWVVLALAGATLTWVVVEIAFVLHGWPGVPRYLFEPAAGTIVLAGVAVGWAVQEAAKLRGRALAWVPAGLVALLALALVPGAITRVRKERKDLSHERARTTQINRLQSTINSLGGYKAVLRCGRPVTNVEYVSIVAWMTRQDVGLIGHKPKFELRQKYPIVLFTPLRNGWGVLPHHLRPSTRASCSSMTALYVPTAHHPGGVLIRH